MRLPNLVDRADSEVVRWTSFYEYTFKLGIRFPLPKLIRDVLIYFELALGQLMPNGWRLLMCLIQMRLVAVKTEEFNMVMKQLEFQK
ncbi:hypothetical protein TorRG33x02_242660 [Trema orientale]|uniref:Uncharacterized protein n=1 Tax=Trema orientale TaxID=63057 RepID=A0A2P5DSR7_TREOI|nr:hypothetical protein TorRG33x02_242660 [Trema orientale]